MPAAPVDTTMETVIQKRSRKPETERNAKWLPTLLMWTFPILILVVIYLYATSSSNQQDPKQADTADMTSATQDPAKVKPSPTAAGGGAVPSATADAAATPDAGAAATTAPAATPEPSPSAAPGAVTVTQDRKSGKTTIYKVSAPAGSQVQVVIASTGVSWLEVYKGENSKGRSSASGTPRPAIISASRWTAKACISSRDIHRLRPFRSTDRQSPTAKPPRVCCLNWIAGRMALLAGVLPENSRSNV